jgi:hypothetical protein
MRQGADCPCAHTPLRDELVRIGSMSRALNMTWAYPWMAASPASADSGLPDLQVVFGQGKQACIRRQQKGVAPHGTRTIELK